MRMIAHKKKRLVQDRKSNNDKRTKVIENEKFKLYHSNYNHGVLNVLLLCKQHCITFHLQNKGIF